MADVKSLLFAQGFLKKQDGMKSPLQSEGFP